MFKLQARSVLLTYPQCNLEKEYVLHALENKTDIKYYSIGQEHHADGNLHLHCYLYFAAKLVTRDQRYFDIDGHHPNIISNVRSRDGSIKYTTKEDENPLQKLPSTDKWGDIVNNSKDGQEFLQKIKETYPREYCLNLERLEYTARNVFKPPKVTYTPRFVTFKNLPLALQLTNIPTTIDRPKTFVIYGDRGIGKTEWARSHGEHIYIRGALEYDVFMADYLDAGYAVFDDLWEWNFRFLKDFLGGQPTVTITGKYRKPKMVNWGKRSIFLTNEKFWNDWTSSQQKYFFDSVEIFELEKKLY